MRHKLLGTTLTGLVLLAVATWGYKVANAQGNGIVALANGSGQITTGGALRTFSFTAQRDSSNVSRGQAELFNRASGVRVHVDINCLNVTGNVATMSGTVSDSNSTTDPFTPGNPVWFQVADNGHGANSPPDMISLVVFFFGPPGVPCTDTTVLPASIPVEHGNITVH